VVRGGELRTDWLRMTLLTPGQAAASTIISERRARDIGTGT
jgi:hypothetical protein